MSKTTGSQQEYLDKNRWFITASKLKYFLTYWPEAYYYKYVKEIILEEKEKDYYLVWTAFDDLVSFREEKFFDKYYIDDWSLKEDLVKRCEELGINSKGTVNELRERLYWDKIKLTQWQGEQIFWMYEEVKRQPIVELDDPTYQCQVDIECEFEWLKLKGTLDRLSLEKKMIRDRKTSWQFQNFEYNIDTTFDYILSMAFYHVLVKVNHWIDCEVILDVLGKQKPYPYMWYKLDKSSLLASLDNKIIPGLRALKKCQETDTWESIHPIGYVTQNRYWDIIEYKAWEPISRTKLMECDYYSMLKGWIADSFITPMY